MEFDFIAKLADGSETFITVEAEDIDEAKDAALSEDYNFEIVELIER